MNCKYPNCGKSRDDSRHDFITINMPISLEYHQFEPSEPEAAPAACVKCGSLKDNPIHANGPIGEGFHKFEATAPKITKLVADQGPRVDTRRFPPTTQATEARPISPGELLKKISRPIVREDPGPDADYSDAEAGSTRPEPETCKTCEGKGVVLDTTSDLVTDCPDCDNPNPPLSRDEWIPCPICGSEYDGKFCHGCRNTRPEMPPALEDYKNAPSGIGPLAEEWKDKPHRLIYDLVKLASPVPQEPSMECWNCHAEIPTEDRELIACHDCHYKWRAAAPRTHHEPLNAVAIKLLIGRRNNTPWDEVPDSEVDGWLQEAARICKLAAPRTQDREHSHPPIPQYLTNPTVFSDLNLGTAMIATWNNEQWVFRIVNGGWVSYRRTDSIDPSFVDASCPGCISDNAPHFAICEAPKKPLNAEIAEGTNQKPLAQARTQPSPQCPKCGSTDVSLGIIQSLNRIRILCGGCPRADFVTEVADFAQFFTALPEATNLRSVAEEIAKGFPGTDADHERWEAWIYSVFHSHRMVT